MFKKREAISINDKQSNKKRQLIILAILIAFVGIFFLKTMYDRYVEAQKIQQEEKITKWVRTAYEDGYLTEEATQVLSDIQGYVKANSLENEGFIFKTGINELKDESVLKDTLNDLFVAPVIVADELKKDVVLKDFNLDKEIMENTRRDLHEYSREEKYNQKIYEQLTQAVNIVEEQEALGEYAAKESIKKNRECEELRSYLKSSDQLDWEQFSLTSPSAVGKYRLTRSGKISNLNFSLNDLETLTAIGEMSDEYNAEAFTSPASIELTEDGKKIYSYTYYDGIEKIKTTIETTNYLFYNDSTLIEGTSNQSKDYSSHVKLYKGGTMEGGDRLLQKRYLEGNQKDKYINISDYPKIEDTDDYVLLDLTEDYLGKHDETRKKYGNTMIYIDREILYRITYYEDEVYISRYVKI